MSTLLGLVIGQLLGTVVDRQPELSKISNLVSGVRSVGSIANDFRTNGWSLKGSDVSSAFFGGDSHGLV